jgi:MoaA/NifB/PqqE/SkfB family radical SAM enzyme
MAQHIGMMLIEIVGMGQCNLKCPSCPVGNEKDVRNPMGFMKAELLTAIVRKGIAETGTLDYSLYNWGEPLLHPKLPDLVRAVQSEGGRCHLSTNLNFEVDWDALMASNPFALRISCSGFNQSLYGETHRGGDIEKVKRHMRALSEARTRTGATTEIHMLYHRYKNNLDDEKLMKVYCEELGFELRPVWAYLMSFEKNLAFAREGRDAAILTDQDRATIDRLGMPLDKAYEAAKKYRHNPCMLLEDQVVLDFKGDVVLCCAVYDVKEHMIAPYLETPIATIQSRKRVHPSCGPCMEQGNHVLGTYGTSEIEFLAVERVLNEYAAQIDFGRVLATETKRRAATAPAG